MPIPEEQPSGQTNAENPTLQLDRAQVGFVHRTLSKVLRRNVSVEALPQAQDIVTDQAIETESIDHSFQDKAPELVEIKKPNAENYEWLETMLSDSAMDEYRRELDAELADNADLKGYDDIYQKLLKASGAYNRTFNTGDTDNRQALYDEVKELEVEYQKAPPEVVSQYDEFNLKRTEVNRHNDRVTRPDSKEAAQMMDILRKAPKINKTDNSKAPFADSANNTGDSWRNVSDEEVREYLSKRIFVETQPVYGLIGNRFSIKARPGETIKVPIDLIVDISGFSSWTTGGGQRISSPYSDYYDGGSKSLDVAKHYAALPTKIPPLKQINVFIQPNGKVFCDNAGGDSHRVVAALLKGDAGLEAYNVNFQLAPFNLLQ